MRAFNHRLGQGWTRIGSRFLPFADAAKISATVRSNVA